MEFVHRRWSALTIDELYAVLALRAEVFVVEQRCPYLDPDGGDPHASHLWIPGEDGRPLAYTRIFPPGARDDCAVLGRVVSAPSVRGEGFGRTLVAEAVRRCEADFEGDIALGAQKYLERFYASFGFARCGDDYLEDGIEHLPMRRLRRPNRVTLGGERR
ncbi:MAG: GNAT family N-acetyltransferase [Polyangiales bacterium]